MERQDSRSDTSCHRNQGYSGGGRVPVAIPVESLSRRQHARRRRRLSLWLGSIQSSRPGLLLSPLFLYKAYAACPLHGLKWADLLPSGPEYFLLGFFTRRTLSCFASSGVASSDSSVFDVLVVAVAGLVTSSPPRDTAYPQAGARGNS